jgi:hypothetical protein
VKEDKAADKKETDKLTKVANRRNLERVDKANEIDQNFLSKHCLPGSIDEFLPNVIPGQDKSFVPPAWLMQAVKEAAESEALTPLAPPIRLDLSDESVQFNSELLKESDLDMEKFLTKHQDDRLKKIPRNHPNFEFFSEVLKKGMDHQFTNKLSKEQRRAEVTAMMGRGKHQSV